MFLKSKFLKFRGLTLAFSGENRQKPEGLLPGRLPCCNFQNDWQAEASTLLRSKAGAEARRSCEAQKDCRLACARPRRARMRQRSVRQGARPAPAAVLQVQGRATAARRARWETRPPPPPPRTARAVRVCSPTRARSRAPCLHPPHQCRDSRWSCAGGLEAHWSLVVNTKKSETGRGMGSPKGQQ